VARLLDEAAVKIVLGPRLMGRVPGHEHSVTAPADTVFAARGPSALPLSVDRERLESRKVVHPCHLADFKFWQP
jgi:hypothetical protein